MAFARTEVKELEPMVKSGKKRFVRYQEGAELLIWWFAAPINPSST